MALIKLTGGYTPIPEGYHVFQITGAEYKEAFGKLEIRMKTAKGQTHTERFSLMNKNGEPNEGAYNAFSYFARRAMNDAALDDIDPQMLVGRFIRCEVLHDIRPSTKKEGETVTFVNLGDKEPADGVDEEPLPDMAAKPSSQDTPKKKFDLGSILG